MDFGIRGLIMLLVQIYEYVLWAAILATWVPDIMRTSFGRFLTAVTEPYFRPFRRLIPPLRMGMGAIDFSPVVALLAYMFIREGINRVLLYFSL